MSVADQKNENFYGLEVSAAVFKAVSIDKDGTVTDSETVAVNKAESGVSQLVVFLNRLKSEKSDLRKIGIAVPGLVSHQENRIAYSAQIPEQAETDFINFLKAETGLEVTVENDANAAAWGEYKLGAGRDFKTMFYVTLGEGVGGAFIFNGEIWRGVSGFAGEFGYITINSEGMKLEEVASAANVVRRIKNRFHQDSASSLVDIGEDNITIQDVLREAERGDDFSRMMLERTGAYVGTGVASVINLLNVESVVVGGDIVDSQGAVINAIRERAKEFSFVPAFETVSIEAGALKEFAAAIGAALLAK